MPFQCLFLARKTFRRCWQSSGHTPVAFEQWQEAKAVVVGVDLDFDYGRLRAAARAVASGASFFAINLDDRFPVGPGLFDPGCGALAAAIAVASGIEPVAIGKPQPTLFRVAIERLGCPSRQTAMIGDSQSSDIKGGRDAGMFTVWLDPENNDPKPDCADLKVRDLCELHQLWKQARAKVLGRLDTRELDQNEQSCTQVAIFGLRGSDRPISSPAVLRPVQGWPYRWFAS